MKPATTQWEAATALRRADLDPDPLVQFRRWLDAAVEADLPEPTAMTLATATPEGIPSARTVLLKDVDTGFVFYTNHTSRKGHDLFANPHAALVFLWMPLRRQVCVRGSVEQLPREASERYFGSRGRGSQLGAWASPQSQVIERRAVLDERLAAVASRFEGGPVPLPDFWGGFRVVPEVVEFWRGRPDRLHDRFRYERAPSGTWTIDRLGP